MLFFLFGIYIWNLMLSLIGVTCAQTPVTFSEVAWEYVSGDVYPMFAMVGAALLNIFFYIGIIRQTSNLRQNLTLEMFVEVCIKAVLCNAFLQLGISLMKWCFSLASLFSSAIILESDLTFVQTDMDIGAALFYMVFGILFLVVSIVCSITVFLVVYGRFLQLYLLVCTYPVAISTMPGGPGISQTASAWLRTFFAKTFSIVIIALVIAIASKLCNSISFGSMEDGSVADGMIQAVQNLFIMVLLAASVKGSDSIMRRQFAL